MFARFLMQGFWQAPLMAALLVPFPLTAWLGLAVVALINLRRGFRKSIWTNIAAVASISVVQAQVVLHWSQLTELIILWLGCEGLRRTEQLSGFLLSLVGTITLFIVGLTQWGNHELMSYEKALLAVIQDMHIQLPDLGTASHAWMLQSLVLGMSIKLLASVFLGRWWQSVLFFPGAFTEAFLKLTFPSVTASLLMMAAFGVNVIAKGQYAFLSLLFLLPLVVMSAALAHGWVRKTQRGVMWLVGFYVALPFAYWLAAAWAWGRCLRR